MSVLIHVYPADEGGCGKYRMIWPAEALQKSGHDVKIFLPEADQAKIHAVCRDDEQGVPHVIDVVPMECDVVVLQRPLQKLLADSIPFIQKQGVRVVVDMDDDFHAIHPQNAAWATSMPQNNMRSNREHVLRACQLADRVTVTTEALARRYGQERSWIIPNYVPERHLKIRKKFREPNRLGWSGSIATHPNDLQQMGAAFPEVVRKTGSSVWVVGTGLGFAGKVGLGKDFQVMASGWVPIEDYPRRMVDIDVGVVPLESTVFNNAKSWLKGLEFASLGVPFVASPTDAYRDLEARYGIGILQGDRRKWSRTLLQVIQQREELGQQFRENVDFNDLTIERRQQEWIDAWTKW